MGTTGSLEKASPVKVDIYYNFDPSIQENVLITGIYIPPAKEEDN